MAGALRVATAGTSVPANGRIKPASKSGWAWRPPEASGSSGSTPCKKSASWSTSTKLIAELGSGNLHLAAKPGHAAELQEELEHLESQYGYQHLSYLTPDAVSERTSARGFYGALLDDGCRHLHPLKYAVGLARAASEAGVRIYEHSRAHASA